jgi:hypothetical protein
LEPCNHQAPPDRSAFDVGWLASGTSPVTGAESGVPPSGVGSRSRWRG